MTVDTDLGQIWGDVLDEVTLSEGFSPHQRGILRLTRPVGFFSGTAVVAVPNDFTRDNIESRHIPLLCSALERRFQTKVHLTFTVDPTLAPELDDDTTDAVADGTYAHDRTVTLPETAVVIPIHPGMQGPNRTTNWNQGPTVESAGRPMPNGNRNPTHQMSGPSRTAPSGYPGSVMTIGGSSRLNPKYTFDTFVIGTSNRFAHAAAIAVSEAPAQAYNPLVIYGGSGLGKTHLLHAIGNYTLATSAGARVMYVSSEEFTNDFINSIRDSNRNERAPEFQAKYRAVDLLLVDDIQFFAGKTQTQEEFFHTFNTLHNNNKQMVFTSDTNPRDLPDFMERLRSRFEWGLITDVQPPDLETRIAILRKKTLQDRMRVPDDVLEFIADKVATNIRELEGALIRVTAYASLNQSNVDLDMAASVLKNIINDQNLPEVSAGLIMSQTAAHYGFSIEDLCGPSRSRNLVKARQVAMYLCRDMTDMSLPKIGQEFGGRDHTTVMHAVRKMTDQMAQRRTLYNQVQDLTTRIRSEARSSQRGFGR